MDTFRYHGQKLAVTVFETKVNEYVEPTEKNKKLSRKILVAIVRNSQTGTPYTGTAVLHPKEEKTFDFGHGEALAIKRALRAYAVDNFNFNSALVSDELDEVVKEMYRWYRIYTRTQYDEPDVFEKLVKEQEKRDAEIKKMLRAMTDKACDALDRFAEKLTGIPAKVFGKL